MSTTTADEVAADEKESVEIGEGAIPTNNEVPPVDEHPSWCSPEECLANSPTAARRHRSAPESLELCNDLVGTLLVMRVTESVFEPGDLGLEIDVYSRDSDEPHHEVIISRRNLARMSRLTLSLMVRAVMDEAVPVRHFFDTAA